MKHLKYLLLPLLAASLLSGCGDTSTIDAIAEQSAETTALQTAAPETASAAETKSPEELAEPTLTADDSSIVDLTQLSASMVYGQVYDMVYNPDDYVGKTVRVKGPFAYFKDDASGNEYFAVLITDAMACCSQGIEFVLKGEHTYPDDYPILDAEITVTGTFGYYKENGNTYCQLTDAELTAG